MNALHDVGRRLTAMLIALFLAIVIVFGLVTVVAVPSGLVLGGMVTGGVLAEVLFTIYNLIF